MNNYKEILDFKNYNNLVMEAKEKDLNLDTLVSRILTERYNKEIKDDIKLQPIISLKNNEKPPIFSTKDIKPILYKNDVSKAEYLVCIEIAYTDLKEEHRVLSWEILKGYEASFEYVKGIVMEYGETMTKNDILNSYVIKLFDESATLLNLKEFCDKCSKDFNEDFYIDYDEDDYIYM